MSTTLMTHAGATLVDEAALAALPPPQRQGSMHMPVPHSALVGAMRDAATARGWQISRSQFALGDQGHRLFGVMDLLPPEGLFCHEEHGFSIGFRNSTNERLSIRMVAGARVFVCDNLALSGDMIALQRRNTVRLELKDAMTEAFDRYEIHAGLLNYYISELQTTTIDDGTASQTIVRLFDDKVLPLRLFQLVTRNYFRPHAEMTDCLPRTMWGLHNACTRALKVLAPPRRFVVNVALGKALGLSRREIA